jgi:Uncharacterized protein conserved in bacteria (DUF2252)
LCSSPASARVPGNALRGPEIQTNALAPRDRAATGKSLRTDAPRSSHAAWEPAPNRPDPIALLEEQAAERLPELVPIRYGRMFAFFRGAAYVMASDLAGTPRSGIRVQLCGDAHLSNFGGFASAERQMLFDLNDFDETLPGPWEWDVKRLAASVAVAARENGFARGRREAVVRRAVGEYRKAIRDFAGMRTLDVWYARASATDLEEMLRPRASRSEIRSSTGRSRTAGERTARGRSRSLRPAGTPTPASSPTPPLIVPIEDLVGDADAQRLERGASELVSSYLSSLSRDRRRLFERYRYAHLARKVVGVGSVGTRAWVILLLGRDSSDPVFLQVKEAGRSVLEPFLGRSGFRNQGRRVVEGQRLIQAAGDSSSDGCAPRAASTTIGRATTTCASCGTGRPPPTSPRCAPRRWASTRGCARGRWRAPMRAPAIRSRSRATSAPAMCSIARSPRSPRPTRSRTSAITRRSSARSRAAEWRLRPGSE